MLKKIKKLHYKELLLYGFYTSYIILITLAAIIDLIIKNYIDAQLEFSSVLLAIIILYNYMKYNNYELATISLFWISSLLVFLFMINNEFDIGVIFTVLLPLIAFLLLPIRYILLHVTIYYLLLITIFIYGYTIYENHSLLYDAKRMNAYLIANLFVISFGIFYHLSIEASYKELELANRQKSFLIKEMHHRVKNNLNIIASILGIQKLESNSKEVHHIIDQNRLRLESMAMAHEILYQCDNLASINFKTYLNKLCNHILKIESEKNNIKLILDISPIFLNIDKVIQFGIMINELITNSIKYAFPNRKEATICISLKKKDKGYLLSYCDNGRGVTLNKIQKGFGYSLIEMTIQQLNGELKIINNNGLCYKIFLKGLKNESINC